MAGKVPPPDVSGTTEKDRAYLFAMLVRVVAADGKLHERELGFLKQVAPSFGYKEDEVEKIAGAATATAAERLAARK